MVLCYPDLTFLIYCCLTQLLNVADFYIPIFQNYKLFQFFPSASVPPFAGSSQSELSDSFLIRTHLYLERRTSNTSSHLTPLQKQLEIGRAEIILKFEGLQMRSLRWEGATSYQVLGVRTVTFICWTGITPPGGHHVLHAQNLWTQKPI